MKPEPPDLTNPEQYVGKSAAIGWELLNFLRACVPAGATVVELGSGYGTCALSKYYNTYSIEHLQEWVGLCPSHYIYAPLVDGWYEVNVVRENLPSKYGALLIDGPKGVEGRWGFLQHMELFDLSVWVFVDDVNRAGELEVYRQLCDKLKRAHCEVYDEGSGHPKAFGVIAASGMENELEVIATACGARILSPGDMRTIWHVG